MESAMNKQAKKQIDAHNAELSVSGSAERFTRANSITTGNAGGGAIEICLRANDRHLWILLQPTEIIELIHQLAAGTGCLINIQPRNDFGSWRQWKESSESQIPLTQWAPLGQWAPHSTHPPTAIPNNPVIRNETNEQTMAIEKPKNRRNTKRASAAA